GPSRWRPFGAGGLHSGSGHPASTMGLVGPGKPSAPEGHPRVTKAWVDSGYRTKAIDHGARLGIDVEVTRRDPAQKGFKVIPRRWAVERTFGWLMHHRRLARDYETHPHRSEAMIRLAMIDLMSRRLTRESTPNWKDS
ncbi:transposase, partial [Streptomyces clavifer]|uniref:transposase n=1 Tax=Streptomyces clavifer TaxID=68188 RepID=UPI00340141EE